MSRMGWRPGQWVPLVALLAGLHFVVGSSLAEDRMGGTEVLSGSVEWDYGSGIPEILCSMTAPCHIALQAGETLSFYDLGDHVRWEGAERSFGPGGNRTVLVVRPRECGLRGNLATIATDKERVYQVLLRSECSSDEWNPSVGQESTFLEFSYPLEWIVEGRERKKAAEADDEARTSHLLGSPDGGLDVGDLRFGFLCRGKGPRPRQVFTVGDQTAVALAPNSPWPAVVSLTGKKAAALVGEKKGSFLVLPRVLSRFELRFGDGKRNRVRCERKKGAARE